MLNKADGKDIEWLKARDVRLVVDIRTAGEAERNSDAFLGDIGYVNHYLQDETNTEGLNFRELSRRIIAAESEEARLAMVPGMSTVYSEMINIDYSRRRFCELIRLIVSHRNGALLFHCTSGKDRTGMTAAMLCTILGAERDDIYKDYYLSLEHAKWEGEQMRPIFKASGASDVLADRLASLFTVDSSFLDAFFRAIEERCGSTEAFIRDEIALGETDIESFRNWALE